MASRAARREPCPCRHSVQRMVAEAIGMRAEIGRECGKPGKRELGMMASGGSDLAVWWQQKAGGFLILIKQT